MLTPCGLSPPTRGPSCWTAPAEALTPDGMRGKPIPPSIAEGKILGVFSVCGGLAGLRTRLFAAQAIAPCTAGGFQVQWNHTLRTRRRQPMIHQRGRGRGRSEETIFGSPGPN